MDEKLMDMHIHTTYSDGEKSPKEIYQMAKERCMSTFSITDHDNILGAKELEKMNIKDINFINGVEMSANCSFGQLHILGYDLDLGSQNLNESLNDLRLNSHYNLQLVLKSLYDTYPNIRFKDEDIMNIFNLSRQVNRTDLGLLFVKYHICSTVQEAFDKYLVEVNNKIKHKRRNLNYEDVIKLIINNNGVPVLAHNNSLRLSKEELDEFIGKMRASGLMGIEAYHSTFNQNDVDYSLYLANKYNLLISGGSDYHGPGVKNKVELATGTNNNLKIKQLTLVDYINKRR